MTAPGPGIFATMMSIAKIPFFRDVKDIDFPAFDRRVSWKRCEEGETIVDFEDPTSDVYFLLHGEMRVLIRTISGREIILAELHGGEFFGELSAIDGVHRSANVTALTRSEMCIMPGSVFRELIFTSRVACHQVLRQLTGRVREMNARLTEHSVFDLKHRLYAELLRLSHDRHDHPGERVISPPPFHHVLSARIGCRREQVTRELSALSHEHIVERSRGGLILKKPKVLRDRLDEALSEDG